VAFDAKRIGPTEDRTTIISASHPPHLTPRVIP
jgi:hypothetical protein